MGINGWLAGEYIASGMDYAVAGIRANAAADAHLADVQELMKQINQAMSINAANIAEKHALRVALAKLDPKHPLITNKSLQERIQNAGKMTLAVTNDNWKAVAIAGQTFKY